MRFAVVAMMLVLAGCAPRELVVEKYRQYGRSVYPAVSVVVNDGYVPRSRTCVNYACSVHVDRTSAFLVQELRRSNLFERVYINDANAKYKIYISIERTNDAWQFTKLMFGGATMFLFPITFQSRYEVRAVVVDEGDSLADIRFDLDAEERIVLFVDLDDHKKQVMKAVIARFLKELENHDVFPGAPRNNGAWGELAGLN